jgi:GNAT superfamily N-acetyltransferase
MNLINYRPYQESDLIQLMELNKSLVKTWLHYTEEGTVTNQETLWENLTSRERYLHGGPWNDPDTLKIHTDEFLKFGGIHVIENEENEIIAQIEFHQFEEDKFHIDWMMVSPKSDKMGIGSLLIEKLGEFLNNEGYNNIKIYTEPEEGTIGFYEKNKFEKDEFSFLTRFRDIIPIYDDMSWAENKDDLLKFTYGMSDTTDKFLGFLMRCNFKYSRLFKVNTNNYSAIINHRNKEIKIILMSYPVFPKRIRIIVTSGIKLTNQDILNIVNKVVKSIIRESKVYFTILDNNEDTNDKGWKITAIIPNLIKSLND